MGIDAFAERARRELLATGATARKRTIETRDQLTAQETQIARLARDGLSNPGRWYQAPRLAYVEVIGTVTGDRFVNHGPIGAGVPTSTGRSGIGDDVISLHRAPSRTST